MVSLKIQEEDSIKQWTDLEFLETVVLIAFRGTCPSFSSEHFLLRGRRHEAVFFRNDSLLCQSRRDLSFTLLIVGGVFGFEVMQGSACA